MHSTLLWACENQQILCNNAITDNGFINDNCYFTDNAIEDESSEFDVYEWNDNRLDYSVVWKKRL